MRTLSRIATCTIERPVRFGKTRTSPEWFGTGASIATQKEQLPQ
jgi:hypothetical protein